MKMTKQEVKDEYKQSDGDPFIKGKIKNKQMEMSLNRMITDVPRADVVITNPTHYAVALKYDSEKSSAPKVIAKGVNEAAQRIKKVAREHNIPMYEDKPLAQALYKHCDLNSEIPENLFHAVAKVLAYIYQLKNNKQARKSII